MTKVLIVSDSPAIQSGLGRVTRELAARLYADGVEVHVAGWFDIHADTNQTFDYPVYPATKMLEKSLAPLLEQIDPDTVLAIGDVWDFEWLATQRAAGSSWRLVGYLNIEGSPLPLACERILDAFDVLHTTSEFGAKVIGRTGVTAVHHGVDSTVFKPLGGRRGMFVGHSLAETFLVLLNGQNTARKNYPAAIAGFALFAEGKSDVLLYANTNPAPHLDDMPGPDLRQTVVNLGLTDKNTIWFNPENHGPLASVPDDHVNRLYNMASALLVTSWAEGFCLPVLEAQAVGAVPVAPNDYSMPELLEDRGFLYPVAARVENQMGMNVAVVSAQHVAAALEQAYQEWKLSPAAWNQRVTACRLFARAKSWDDTYRGLKDSLLSASTNRSRVAKGRAINPQLRLTGRQVAARHPNAFGVLKLGGLGDLLQTTVVVRAAAQATGRPAIVFTNQPAPVFEGMPEVAEVVQIAAQPQQMALDSLADSFPAFYDLRYVSWAYGEAKPSVFAQQHRWFYDHWTASCGRLHTLRLHSTEIMLKSLGLEAPSIRPIYTPRQQPREEVPPLYLLLASGAGAMGGLKRWPDEYWGALVDDIYERYTIQAIQIGAHDALIPGAIDMRYLTLPETAWLMDHARGLVTVEGGMMHLAAATNVPTSVIFGPTPQQNFLYDHHRPLGAMSCTPCWGVEPMWSHERCALGEQVCVNFPSLSDVVNEVRRLVNGD